MKKPVTQGENQQQTQLTRTAGMGIKPKSQVEGECLSTAPTMLPNNHIFLFQDLKFKLPKVSSSGFRVFIRDHLPWKLKQVIGFKITLEGQIMV